MNITYKGIELDKLSSIKLNKLISKTDLSQLLDKLGNGWEYILSNDTCANYSKFENKNKSEYIMLQPDLIGIKNKGLHDSFLGLVKSSGDVWNSGNEAFESFNKSTLEILGKYGFEGVEEVIFGMDKRARVTLMSDKNPLNSKYVFQARHNNICYIIYK